MSADTPVTGAGIGGLSTTGALSRHGQRALRLAQRRTLGGMRRTPERLLAPEPHDRTPVPGRYLAGQDVVSLGIAGATVGGFMAAASIEPRLGPRMAT